MSDAVLELIHKRDAEERLRGLHQDGLARRLFAFFTDNPGEELTQADACAKFGVLQPSVSVAVKQLRDRGLLEQVSVIRLPEKGRAS